MLLLQPAEFTSENVPDFPVKELLYRFLSHIYDIQCVNMDALQFGLPLARLRSYQIGRHKGKTLFPTKSLVDHVDALKRPAAFSWESLFWMSDDSEKTVIEDEILNEWRWASKRPCSQANVIETEGQQAKSLQDDLADHGQPFKCVDFKWERALTQTEIENAKEYQNQWPNMVFNLNQSAEKRGNKSAALYLQTFIWNFGIMFTFSPKIQTPRWIFASEALTAMGFPVFPKVVECQAFPDQFLLTSFNVPRCKRRSADIRAQCGNTDSLLLASVAELYSLLHVRLLG